MKPTAAIRNRARKERNVFAKAAAVAGDGNLTNKIEVVPSKQ
jgi:hypothetical protein